MNRDLAELIYGALFSELEKEKQCRIAYNLQERKAA